MGEAFPKLQELNLADNGISNVAALDGFSRCEWLETLGLHFNELTAPPKKSADGQWPALKSCQLQNNKLTLKELPALKTHPKLRHLRLSHQPAVPNAYEWAVLNLPRLETLG